MVVRASLLDPTTHDFVYVNGCRQMISDGPSVAQAVDCALRTFLGEWFLDSNPPVIGVPWFQAVLIRNPDANILRSIFTSVIEGVAGVDAVQSLQLMYDSETRVLSVVWSATTNLGALISGNTSV